MSPELPLIGACMNLATLEQQRDWIVEGQRDLEISEFARSEILEGDWRPAAERVRQLLDGYQGRLGIHGPFRGFSVDTLDIGVRAVVQRRLQQGLDVCEAIGATQMVVHSPYRTWDANNMDNHPGVREQKLEAIHLSMDAAVRRAESMGLTLVIENIEDKDPRDRLDMIRSFNSTAVAVSIDTGHAHYAHGSTGAPPVDYFVHSAGNHLAHVHIQDADGFADRHWAPGRGSIHWHGVFAALAQLTSKPRLVLELFDKSQIRQGADYLIAQGLAR